METVKVYYPHMYQDYWAAAVVARYNGHTFVSHPVYDDEAPIQKVLANGSIAPTWAWDIKELKEDVESGFV